MEYKYVEIQKVKTQAQKIIHLLKVEGSAELGISKLPDIILDSQLLINREHKVVKILDKVKVKKIEDVINYIKSNNLNIPESHLYGTKIFVGMYRGLVIDRNLLGTLWF